MKKRKLILIVTFICFSIIFFLSVFKEEMIVLDERQKTTNVITIGSVPAYYMKMDGNMIIVYNADHSIYEYTDLKMEFLPDELKRELTEGKYFDSQEELYEFLETYTS